MRARYLLGLVLVVALCWGAAGAPGAAAAPKTVKCGKLSVYGSHWTDVTGTGLTCKQVKTLLMKWFNPQGVGPPAAWKSSRRSLGGGNYRITFRDGKKSVSYSFHEQ